MKLLHFSRLILLILLFGSCNAQEAKRSNRKLLGSCEGCEAVFEYGNRELSDNVILPDYNGVGKKIKISGTIYLPDGKTPAKDVVLYTYHTDQGGNYTTAPGDSGWALRNGSIRAWIKTGDDGKYSFQTLWPGIYPARNAPAHIHPVILEPNGRYYWLNSYLFEGDSLITARDLNPSDMRGGGNGVIKMEKQGDLWVGKRDIILGKNVPGY